MPPLLEPRYWNLDRHAPDASVRVNQLTGAVMSFRRRVVEEHPFDERFTGYGWGEDFEYCYRVSRTWPVFIAPGARVAHYHAPAGRTNFRAARRDEIAFHLYFYRRHLRGSPADAIALGWLLLGILLAGLDDEVRGLVSRLRAKV